MQAPQDAIVRRHLVFGWWSLLIFLGLGIALELLHGFKHPLLLDVSNETRRMMWRLAHAHGALLGLVHVAFATTLALRPGVHRTRLVSRCLVGASLLLPGGFFLGGIVVYESDPWVGVFLAPVGAALFVVGVLVLALEVTRAPHTED